MLCVLPQFLQSATILGDIKIDHFGYRTTDQKIAYFTANPGSSAGVYNAATNALVYSNVTITSKGADQTSPVISGDTLWWVDFSSFTTPGQYYIMSTGLNEQSYNFQISDCIYQAPMTATLKALYYQRCGTDKPAQYAGANWADADACHTGDAQCSPAPDCTFPVNYGTLDLSGGWHDAGDYNKYIGSSPCDGWGGDSGSTLHYLLTAYEWNPGLFPDSQTNIPESGNGIPDILDECKWELDWYLKMQMTDYHVLSVVHQPNFNNTGSPPSTDPTVRYYYPSTPTSEAQFVAVLSDAARVMSTVPALASYAMTLKAAAENTWNAYEASSWPGAGDFKFWAAAEIFRMEEALGGSSAIISEAQNIIDNYQAWNGLWLNENQFQLNRGMLAYMQSAGATASVVGYMKADWAKLVGDIFTQNANDLYNSGMHSYDYFWGANEVKMNYAMELLWAAKLGMTGTTYPASQCIQHAEDFLHYLNGVNPMNMTYMTNAAAIGASHGVWRIYHMWFGSYNEPFSYGNFMGKPASVTDPLYPYFSGVDNYGITDTASSLYGPPPGIVPDGACDQYYTNGGKAIPPLLTGGAEPPYEKDYRDWNYSDPSGKQTVPWIVNETGIYYTSSYMIVASAFTSMTCTAQTATPTITGTPPSPTDTPSITQTLTLTLTGTNTPTFTQTPVLCEVMNYTGEAPYNMASGGTWVNTSGTVSEVTTQYHSPTHSMEINFVWTGGWYQAMGWNWTNWAAANAYNASSANAIDLWLLSGSGTITTLNIEIVDSTNTVSNAVPVSNYLPGGITNTWQELRIPLSVFTGVNMASLWEIRITTGGTQTGNQTIYMDDFGFMLNCGTITATPTITPYLTATISPTPGASPSVTITPTLTQPKQWPEKIYPNPYNPGLGMPLNIGVNVSPADEVTFKIYTSAFRLIKEYKFGQDEVLQAYNSGILQYGNISDLAPGYYFYVVAIESGPGKSKNNPGTLIILK